MNAENRDRRALYRILAKRLKLSVKVVGKDEPKSSVKSPLLAVWLQDSASK